MVVRLKKGKCIWRCLDEGYSVIRAVQILTQGH